MTFIPHKRGLRIGDRVISKQQLSTLSGTFTTNHKFTIVDVGTMAGIPVYHLRDDDGRCINDVPGTHITLSEE